MKLNLKSICNILASASIFFVLFFIEIDVKAQDLSDLTDFSIDLRQSSAKTTDNLTERTFESGVLLQEWTGFVIQGVTDDPDLAILFRPAGGQGQWMPLQLFPNPTTDDFFASFRDENTVRSGGVEVKIITGAEFITTISAGGTFDNRLDEDNIERSYVTPSLRIPTSRVVSVPTVIRRTAWNADPFLGTPSRQPSYKWLTLHHAAGFSATTLAEGKVQVKAIQELHQDGRGWSDIGYQFVADKSGDIFQGRPFANENKQMHEGPDLVIGAHVGGHNTSNIGLCVLGCYHPPEGGGCEDQLTSAALDSVIHMFAFLSETYNISPDSLRGHRDWGNTACPGDNNYRLLGDIKAGMRDLLAGKIPEEPPTTYHLDEVYPNPVNTMANIPYFLSAGGLVSISVYNLLGRWMESTILSEWQDGNLWYSTEVEVSQWPAGVYFVQFTVDGFSGVVAQQTQKFVVVH